MLTEYEAAKTVGMSPTLLRWLTSYAPRPDSDRKLQIAKKEQEILFFDETELLDFNAWLARPWPKKDDEARPGIPAGIRDEIRIEANGECAICLANADKCEAAHIEPFAKSRNHHPSNLLWLCSNHHTAFDKHLFDAKESEQAFVRAAKRFLHFFRRSQWSNQHAVSVKAWEVLKNLDRLEVASQAASTPEQRKATRAYAEQAIKQLKSIAPVSQADPNYSAYQAISTEVTALQTRPIDTTPAAVTSLSEQARRTRQKFSQAMDYAKCPLCGGSGDFKSEICPECDGEGEMPQWAADRVDVGRYADVDCPLCKGKGTFQGSDCPECNGTGEMPKWAADRVDVDRYEDVDCPLCEGKGTFQGSDCPECNGTGEMPKWAADRVDVDRYEDVDCPLCEGKGTFQGSDCPECNGTGEMPKWAADRVDVDRYEDVDCPLCEGKGTFQGSDCPECNGTGEMPKWAADRVDVDRYEDVDCPLCEGKGTFQGNDCPECDGTGEMPQWAAERVDVDRYL